MRTRARPVRGAADGPPNSAEGAVALTQNLIEISENELSEIRALDAPPEVEEALDRTYGRASRESPCSSGALRRRRTGTRVPTPPPRPEIAAGQVRRLKLAQAVGFTECSVVPTGTAGG